MVWPILIRKTCTTFSSDLSKPRKFQKLHSDEDSGRRLRFMCMYTGIGVPFPFVWIGYILCYYICKFGVGFCCFLFLLPKVFLGPRKARVMRVIDSYAFLFIIAITNTNNLLCLGNRWSIFIGLGDTDMAKKIDLQALYQQINELQIDKDLNRGKLHPLSEKFTIFAT